ncbi:MAG TPA: SOS response-associated peptidase [Xanthobacteraceae bacterium]|nr:SOS response-associated peptidase [Xanthobacteraceae bacterium]
MCGRFALHTSPDYLRRLLGFVERPNFPARYNIAPMQPVALVRIENGERHFTLARWGLVPSWVKDPKKFALLINARAEGIATRPSFRAAIRRRRCLIPADGFYEWRREGKAKVPYFIRRRDGEPMAFAGIWETWADADGGEIDTAAIVTCAANASLMPIHERMPAIIPPGDFTVWLDADETNFKAATALLKRAPDDWLEAHEVSPRVNKVANDDAENIVPVDRTAAIKAA